MRLGDGTVGRDVGVVTYPLVVSASAGRRQAGGPVGAGPCQAVRPKRRATSSTLWCECVGGPLSSVMP
jgi:hypothetical protein